MVSSNTRSRRPSNVRMVQNFHLVWLDGNIDEENNEDCRNYITKLRQVVNTVNTFTDVDECIDFITDTNQVMTYIMVSGEHIQIVVPIVQEISQVNSVYIFGRNKTEHEEWAKQWSKVKGMFTDITSIYEALKQAVQDCDQNSVSISFVQKADGSSNQNLDTLNPSFMYTQILKEILITIDFGQSHINDFLSDCSTEFAGNTLELKNVEKLRKEYHDHQPIWWYTYQSFLYSMLNRALRLMEVDRIIKMGFFLRHLHQNIAELHTEQFGGQNHSDSFIVYRGQGLSLADFDQLNNTQGGLLAFNNFLSTSKNRRVSLNFAKRTVATSDLMGVLFVMDIDPSIPTTPFANVADAGYYQAKEEEILFSMHSTFRIGQVQQFEGNNRLYQVNLTLTSDNDPQLHALTKSMQKETFSGAQGWDRLGILMIKLGEFNKAEELYNILFEQTNDKGGKAFLYHMFGMVNSDQGKYVEAVECYENSIKINQRILSPTHSDLTASYNNIGMVFSKMGEYSKALSYHEKALEIQQKTLPANHPDLATSYNNMGGVYGDMKEYSKALSYYEKALEIRQKTLPANHPDLATSFGNIGMVYDNMGEYPKALSYYGKALEIRQKTLPVNHPDLATSYNNIGMVFSKMGEYSKALSYSETALAMREKTFPANHPDLATSYNNIGLVCYNMEEYSKALSYFEKTLEIFQETLSANHPLLATSYNNIGRVYDHMKEYSKALSYYEKALEIFQKTLPVNHPDLATSYNNIGTVYYNMGEYSKALSYYEKALEIFQKTLPVNHTHLATSYNNIGWIYRNKGDYSKALSYFERALDIWKRSVPSNHPNIKNVKESIENVRKKL